MSDAFHILGSSGRMTRCVFDKPDSFCMSMLYSIGSPDLLGCTLTCLDTRFRLHTTDIYVLVPYVIYILSDIQNRIKNPTIFIVGLENLYTTIELYRSTLIVSSMRPYGLFHDSLNTCLKIDGEHPDTSAVPFSSNVTGD